MDKHQFKVSLQWKNEREGVISSPELEEGHNTAANNSIDIATPPPFPGGVPNIWSPEHLFTASISSCLMTTFLAIAENSKLDFEDFSCDAIGIMEKKDGKFLMTEVHLKPIVTIKTEEDQDRAERVLQKSEKACLISNSVKSEISMETKIITKK